MMKKNDESGEEQELSREHGSKSSKKNLQPLENATSVVWKFLAFWWKILEPEKGKQTEAYCNKCYAPLKYTGGSCNLRYHLEKTPLD